MQIELKLSTNPQKQLEAVNVIHETQFREQIEKESQILLEKKKKQQQEKQDQQTQREELKRLIE